MDLLPFARKYIWWQPPERAVEDQRRLVAQIMNIGTYADVETVRAELGDGALKHALHTARAGEFSERSWHYWHLTLGLATPHNVPRLPERKLA